MERGEGRGKEQGCTDGATCAPFVVFCDAGRDWLMEQDGRGMKD